MASELGPVVAKARCGGVSGPRLRCECNHQLHHSDLAVIASLRGLMAVPLARALAELASNGGPVRPGEPG